MWDYGYGIMDMGLLREYKLSPIAIHTVNSITQFDHTIRAHNSITQFGQLFFSIIYYMEPYNKLSESLGKIQSDLTKDLLSAGYLTGIIIMIIGLIFLVSELVTVIKIMRIGQWPTIKDGGTILDSYLETTQYSTNYSILVVSENYSSTLYRTRAAFSYKLNGNSYVSNNISFYEPWQSNPVIAKLENDKFKPGTTVDIKVNPRNNSEAYVTNYAYDKYSRIAIFLAITLIGLYIVIKVKK